MSPLLTSLIDIAREAGRRILTCYNEPSSVDYKADNSPVTCADRLAHDTIVTALKLQLPDIPAISEEDADPARSMPHRFFLVDPLDGTKEFIKHSGEFTVNIGLIESGRPVAGVVHVPVSDLTYASQRGDGAWKIHCDGSPLRISVASPQTTLRFVASRDHAAPRTAARLARFPDAECLSIGSSLKFL